MNLFRACQHGVSVCILMSLLATGAMAQEGHWYAGIKGGISGGAEADLPLETATGNTNNLTLETGVGPVVMGAVGYATGNGFQVEGEISWRRNDIDTLTGITVPLENRLTSIDLTANGRLDNVAFMVNGIYTIQSDSLLATPFLLGGIGVSRVEGEVNEITGIRLPVALKDDETVFAYQAGGGIACRLTETVTIDISYRFFGTSEVELEQAKMDNTHHNGLVGLTYAF